jgi:hemoglobin
MTTVDSTRSMYDRAGGGPAVRAVVERLYSHILEDPQLTPYFVGVDLPHVKRHMAALLAQTLGGPVEYQGKQLQQAHAKLGITQHHLDRVIDYALSCLYYFHVDHDIIAAAGEALRSAGQHVVTAR